MDLKQVLQKTAIFSGLSTEELQPIMSICNTQKYKQGDSVFTENSKGKQIYIIEKGRVKIQLQVKGKGDYATIHRIMEGETFGELVLVSEGRRSAGVACETDCEIIAIDRDSLVDVFNKNARIGYITMRNLASVLATRLRKTDLQLIACFLWE